MRKNCVVNGIDRDVCIEQIIKNVEEHPGFYPSFTKKTNFNDILYNLYIKFPSYKKIILNRYEDSLYIEKLYKQKYAIEDVIKLDYYDYRRSYFEKLFETVKRPIKKNYKKLILNDFNNKDKLILEKKRCTEYNQLYL